jgi:ADP-ribose pyrophosphatase YjhB (NUDIX family)
MAKELSIKEFLLEGEELFLPSLSVDCVIFGFHEEQLKVLLLHPRHNKRWALPGGFIYKQEDVDRAAKRVLQERTGLSDIFLQQFHLFGEAGRTRQKHARKMLQEAGISDIEDHWIMRRFVTLGFYALVEYSKVTPKPDRTSTECTWWDVSELPELIIDHQEIIQKALEALRIQLNYQPIGYNLLAKDFTIKELQLVYETILGRRLDRRNFQRKILSYGILDRKEKQYTGAAHKAPFLYSFNKEKYFQALEKGFEKEW